MTSVGAIVLAYLPQLIALLGVGLGVLLVLGGAVLLLFATQGARGAARAVGAAASLAGAAVFFVSAIALAQLAVPV